MPDLYSLPPKKARVCRIAGAIFLVFAAVTLVEPVVLSIWPAPTFGCAEGCHWKSRPIAMLDDDVQAEVEAAPGGEAKLAIYIDRSVVRAGIFGVSLIDSLPFAALLMGVGIALRRLGSARGNRLGQALPWLRRASLAAILWAFAQPISQSLMASLLSPGAPEGEYWYFMVDFVDVGTGLMLAIAAYAAVWALEGGLKAQRDLDEFV
ncbi:hypothetical protein [uncultured Sphingomonas sp.]|uniref:hypothetical protein n=1 Tax=uncultured Sphingomonas sp. TaxID=158754 RepID=UPI0025E60C63|nr:hypothetical protein [uncultured Sphingomonas sp.]